MNAKRILPWEHYDDDNWTAETKIEDYHVNMRDYSTEPAVLYEASCGNEWPRCLGEFENPNAAMDACEADYIERCSEFLRVAGPGEVVVPIKIAMDAHDTAISSRHFWVKFADMLARFDNAINGLSAAIDAARGSK